MKKQIGSGSNIIIILLYSLLSFIVCGIAVVIDIKTGVFLSILSIILIVVQSKLKDVYVLNNGTISIKNIWGKEEIISTNSVVNVGYSIYPYCFIEMQDGKTISFQVPLNKLFTNRFYALGKKKNYIDEMTEIINTRKV